MSVYTKQQTYAKRLNWLFSHFINLANVAKILNATNITWVMGGSAALYAQGNEREPGDIDIFIRNDQHDQVDKLFNIQSIYNESATDKARLSYPFKDKLISLHSNYMIIDQGYRYHWEVAHDTKKMDYYSSVKVGNEPFYIIKAEEVLLTKAITKRGDLNGNKCDLDDIKNFNKLGNIDQTYLKKRFAQMRVDQATKSLLIT